MIDDILIDYHSRLIDEILPLTDKSSFKKIIEFGSGSGLFTIPLLNRLYPVADKIHLIDPYIVPYTKDKGLLTERIMNNRFNEKTHIEEIFAWEMNKIGLKADLIIGHDVFCDMNEEQILNTLITARNSMKENGLFIHAGLSPIASTKSERLLIHLDNKSTIRLNEYNWFSPDENILVEMGNKAGFNRVVLHHRKIQLKLFGDEALLFLRKCTVSDEVLNEYQKEIDRIGIEFPPEDIFICRR